METARKSSATAESEAGQSVLDATTGWISAARERATLIARLAAAEARLAATSLVLIVALAIAIAIMFLSAWGLLAAGLVYGLHQSGVSLWASLTGLAALHIVIALLLARRAAGLGANLKFAATRRQFAEAAEPTP